MQTGLAGDRNDTLDLRQLLMTLWQGRWWIVAATVLGGGVAIAYALLAPPVYRAEALVQVRQESGAGPLNAFASQYGDLAALAGLGAGTGGGDRAMALATLKSRVVIQAFIQENHLLPILFEKAWDLDNKRWKSGAPPTLWHGYKFFSENLLKVTEDRKTNLVVIAIEWRDPEVAAAWVTDLIARTNTYLRNKTLHESRNNLEYLRQQAKETAVVELQRAVYALMESELKKLMFASGSDEYAIRTIDPAQAPKLRIKPQRRQIAVTGILLGGFLGIVAVLLRSLFFSQPATGRMRESA
jgi:uncharacterized protein involved in exopolysaccharide biosynthesis